MSLTLAPAPVSWPADAGAAPKYATPRDPSAPTDGPRIATISKALGKPLLPWQRYCADVATERDSFGNYKYEVVLITVPRQSGKTTLVGPVQLDRIIMNPGVKVFYTAQTGKDARSRFGDLVQLIQASPLHLLAQYRFSAGSESVGFPNGSALQLFAPVMAALHGETPPLVTLDEIWEWDEVLGDAILEGAIIPAQMTLAGRRQVWMISTAGSAQSRFMRKWVDRGRAGGWPRMAYFEWGLADGDDPYDLDAIRRFHPAVGYTVTAEELLAIGNGAGTGQGISRGNWLRAFCNVWTEAADPLISAEDWEALAVPQAPRKRSDIAITYEVTPGNQSGVVMATWRDDAGAPNARVIHAAPGTAWMRGYLLELARTWQPAVFGADDGGPTRRLTDELRRELGDDAIRTTGGREFGTACEALLTYARDDRTLVHDGSRTLAREVAGAVLQRTGDVQRFSRNGPVPVPGLIATAVGLWLWDHQDSGLGAPLILSLGDL